MCACKSHRVSSVCFVNTMGFHFTMFRLLTIFTLTLSTEAMTCTLTQQSNITRSITEALATCDHHFSSMNGMSASMTIFAADAINGIDQAAFDETLCLSSTCVKTLETLTLPSCIFQFQTGYRANVDEILTNARTYCVNSKSSRSSSSSSSSSSIPLRVAPSQIGVIGAFATIIIAHFF